jgi:hypothetical protein
LEPPRKKLWLYFFQGDGLVYLSTCICRWGLLD